VPEEILLLANQQVISTKQTSQAQNFYLAGYTRQSFKTAYVFH